MNVWGWVLLVGLAWAVVSVPAAVGIGRMLDVADRRDQQERASTRTTPGCTRAPLISCTASEAAHCRTREVCGL